MPFKQKLEHHQKQVFSQSLRQAIKILELPILDLREAIETEIGENPVVEETSQIFGSAPKPEKTSASTEEPYGTPDESTGIGGEEPTEGERLIPNRRESLYDVLLRQLRINAADDDQVAIGTHLIFNIDKNGYLDDGPTVTEALNNYTPEAIKQTRELIQTFDPPGVGARNLKECLLIQLIRQNDPDPITHQLIDEFLEELATPPIEKLTKKCKCTPQELAAALQKIHTLEPKPGRRFDNEDTAYIIPDITVEEKDQHLMVIVEDRALPIIRVNPIYRGMLRVKNVDQKTKDFIREKIKNATNLMNAIQGRRETLLRVVGLIANIQKDAMLEGLEKLNPLALKEIAERLKLHESTVSRVIMHKYIQAPAGIFALKDFFSTGLKTANGEDVAAQKIKMKIQELINQENKAHPLRDQAIAELIIKTENITLARRTIAKYREGLKIPPVSQRRRNSGV